MLIELVQGQGTALVGANSKTPQWQGRPTTIILDKRTGAVVGEPLPSAKKFKSELQESGGERAVRAPPENEFLKNPDWQRLSQVLWEIGTKAEAQAGGQPREIEGALQKGEKQTDQPTPWTIFPLQNKAAGKKPDAPKIIEPRVHADGERPAEIFFNSAEMQLIEDANPGTIDRIKRVLTTSFSKLKAGVDYDRQKGRSVYINLSQPVNINDEKVAVLKIKGVVFDRGQATKSYNRPDLQMINFDTQGRTVVTLEVRIPTGGMTLYSAQVELSGAMSLHERRVPGPVGLGVAHFSEDKAEDGGDIGAVLLGLPAGMITMGDKLREISMREDLQPDDDIPLLGLTARLMRRLFEVGLVHNQLHNENILLVGERAYVMDNESLRDVSGMSEAQKFGYLARGISNWFGSVEKVMPAQLRQTALDMLVRAFFSALLKGDKLKMFEKEIRFVVSMNNAQRSALFGQAQTIPLIDLNHPFVTLVKAAFPEFAEKKIESPATTVSPSNNSPDCFPSTP
jgi:hypothetical protein